MEKILFVNACARRGSRTNRLARRLLEKLDGDIREICPETSGLKPMCGESLSLRDELTAAGKISAPELSAAREFAEADIIVIAAPYWDLMFPAFLKIYLENVTVCGVTFRYTDEGIAEGLCRARRLYYVTTSGGPIRRNLGFEYVDALSKEFYGIDDTRFISAEGLDIIGADTEGILEAAARGIKP